jgi:hypothetical protein
VFREDINSKEIINNSKSTAVSLNFIYEMSYIELHRLGEKHDDQRSH